MAAFPRNMLLKELVLFCALIFSSPSALIGQTITEKKASLSEVQGDLDKDSEKFLKDLNRELLEDQETLKGLYRKAWVLYQNHAPEKEYEELLGKIQEVKENIELLENNWRTMVSEGGNSDSYALWHQPETTLGQLVIDYGSEDYVYLIPKDIAQIPLSIGSNLPIPRASWNTMLEQILTQNGVGIRQLNPFLRELYPLKNDKSAVKLITNKRADLAALSPNVRIAFVLSPEPSEVRRTYFFLDNFANRDNSIVQLVGRDILLIGEVQEIQDLLKLSDFVGQNRGDIIWRAVSLNRITPDEMTKILGAIFNPAAEPKGISAGKKGDAPQSPPDANGLKVIKLAPPASGLFLVGTSEEVKKAENVIRDVESQIGGAREKTVFWYTAKYSDPDEIADILLRVYTLMIQTGTGLNKEGGRGLVDKVNQLVEQQNERPGDTVVVENNANLGELFPADNYFEGGFPINPAPVVPASSSERKAPSNRANFIVDQKTSSIVMVVEADILPSIKDLIKRLDVPKKMVQIEVLLFEKRITNVNEFGLNLLRVGSCASNTHKTCALFDDPLKHSVAGIFDFIISRTKDSGIPAFDMIYRFLLSQEGVTINSNPSVVTVNQTPAFIAIQEEQSIDTGTFQLEEANVVALKAFRRAQYGTTIKITPTVHLRADGDQEPFDSITLESDITFDTIRSNNNDRPVVVRRNIKNEARVADGETIILGGLRRKDQEDFKDSIPFLGEIPGVGKLFSMSRINDTSTEMFIFITPKIVFDPSCDLEWIRQEELSRRPGDLPEFMHCLVQAEKDEQERIFEHSMTILFGRRDNCLNTPGWHNDDTCQFPQGEYDGR